MVSSEKLLHGIHSGIWRRFAEALGDYRTRPGDIGEAFRSDLQIVKNRAIAESDEPTANACWVIHEIAFAQNSFAKAFSLGQRDEF